MSILELFILAMIEQGFETPYALHRRAGISLGATNPALKRLSEAKLIVMAAESTASNRPRHRYSLTSAGKKALDLARKRQSQAVKTIDVDETLRSAVLALIFRKPEEARNILLQSATARFSLASARKLDSSSAKMQLKGFNCMDPLKAFVEGFRYEAEAEAFRTLATFLKSGSISKRLAARRRARGGTKG
jgi:DNA-binding PadR family transcriptional regulator